MKRLLALLIASVTVFTLLSSCGKTEVTDGSSDSTNGTGETADSGYTEKAVVKTEQFEVKEGVSAKLDLMGADGYVTSINVTVGGEEKKALDLREVTEITLGHKEGLYSSSGEYAFKTLDMNFDGCCDFLVESAPKGDGNEPYFCYLWDDAKGTFVYGFRVNSPMVDTVSQRIYSTVYEDGAEYVYMYRVFEGSLVEDGHFSLSDSVQFTKDLSGYEKYMNPEDRDGYLLLVNKVTLLDETYKPADLVDVSATRKDGRNTQQMREYAAKALEALYVEMYAAGYTDVSVTSAYRSYDYQNQLFNTYIGNEMANGYSREKAEEIVSTYSARPGTSEHQSGLCCDMHNLGSASQAFANQEAYKWLCDNAWKFGFILRFPEGKEDVTGYTFEPWHYRFVGRYHAEKIHNFGLCFEEYLELVK